MAIGNQAAHQIDQEIDRTVMPRVPFGLSDSAELIVEASGRKLNLRNVLPLEKASPTTGQGPTR